MTNDSDCANWFEKYTLDWVAIIDVGILLHRQEITTY